MSFELEHKIDGGWAGSYRGVKFTLTDSDNTDWQAHHAGGSEGTHGTMQEAINAFERKVDLDLAEQEKRIAGSLSGLKTCQIIFSIIMGAGALNLFCAAYFAAKAHNILGALGCFLLAVLMVVGIRRDIWDS